MWAGTDLFMKVGIGPIIGRMDGPARADILQRLVPTMLFLMPALGGATITAGIYLAVQQGSLQLDYLAIQLAGVFVIVLAVQAFGFFFRTSCGSCSSCDDLDRISRRSGASACATPGSRASRPSSRSPSSLYWRTSLPGPCTWRPKRLSHYLDRQY